MKCPRCNNYLRETYQEPICPCCGYVYWDKIASPKKVRGPIATPQSTHKYRGYSKPHPLKSDCIVFTWGSHSKPEDCVWVDCFRHATYNRAYCESHLVTFIELFAMKAPVWSQMALPNIAKVVLFQYEVSKRRLEEEVIRKPLKPRNGYIAYMSGIWLPVGIPQRKKDLKRLRQIIEEHLGMPVKYFDDAILTAEYYNDEYGPTVSLPREIDTKYHATMAWAKAKSRRARAKSSPATITY